MTQTDGIAVSGGFDYAADSGFYAGIWGSNVNFNDSTGSGNGAEFDYYFGYGFELGEVGVDLGYVAFDYPGNEEGLDFEEIVFGCCLARGGAVTVNPSSATLPTVRHRLSSARTR